MSYIINFFWGFLMALADSVPGVSGGTIAFILGFYDKFISSIESIFYKKGSERITGIKFLLKLGIGWIFGMGAASIVLTSLFEKNIYAVSSLFIGFILFSIPIIIKKEKDALKENYFNFIYLFLGIFIVSLITYLNGKTTFDLSSQFNLLFYLYVILAGMCAISAMVLPGISGSTLLLIFGMYIPIITAVKNLFIFNFSGFLLLLFFFLGIILGVLCVIKLIKKALDNKRSIVIYIILGFMIGSFYAIIMGPKSLDSSNDILNFSNFNILFFIIGSIFMLGLERLNKYFENK